MSPNSPARSSATTHGERRALVSPAFIALRAAVVASIAGSSLMIGGCSVDSYMDPSVVGGWNETPAKTPILERLSAIEGPVNEGIETSQVRPEDLIPEVEAYRVGPGDSLELTVEDFFRDGVPLRLENLEVDPRGYVDLPQVGPIFVYGQTTPQMVASVRKALADSGVLDSAVVNVIVRGRRKLTYAIIGEVATPGVFSISKPDFRVMDALGQAGRFNQQTEKVYIIRRIPLSDRVTGRPNEANLPVPAPAGGAPMRTPGATSTPAGSGGGSKPAVVDLIDELSKPKPTPSPTPSPAPAMFRSSQPGSMAMSDEPVQKPLVDLIEPTIPGKSPTAATPASPTAPTGGSTWVFVNGAWTQSGVGVGGTPSLGGEPNSKGTGGTPAIPGSPNAASELMTQRVIEIPLGPLLAGSSQFDVVIRPGDTIRVPAQNEGVFYVTGQVARPGPYQLPLNGRMTLLRAIDSSGGLSSTAIPERVDLTRMVGTDRQVTIMVNLRAISEGTHPDIQIRPDDRINVGSNFFAFPLAVFRNGLRASYGFGFILDRNFGFDVFGPQQTQSGGF
ncbi:MAG: SLBB domain-containing protein [Phycisphaerales bacterium]|nr:SLBB domain-containing protein [Phycisphaerales bacterium]